MPKAFDFFALFVIWGFVLFAFTGEWIFFCASIVLAIVIFSSFSYDGGKGR